jgi:hypothetical protein
MEAIRMTLTDQTCKKKTDLLLLLPQKDLRNGRHGIKKSVRIIELDG